MLFRYKMGQFTRLRGRLGEKKALKRPYKTHKGLWNDEFAIRYLLPMQYGGTVFIMFITVI